MTHSLSFVTAAVLIGALAAPAAAQDRDWADRIEQFAETRAREALEALGIDDQRQRDGDAARGPAVTDRLSRTIRLGRTGTFDLSNVSGDVIVTGGGDEEVRIEAVKRTYGRDEAEARSRMQEVRIDIREQPGRVEVRTEYPRRRDLGVWVDYTVTVPRDTNVTLKTVSGDVQASSINGELRVQSVSGDIALNAARRLATVTSVSGDVRITEAESATAVEVTTVSGDLLVQRLKASGVETTTVSGDVNVECEGCQRVTIKTVSGDIRYVGELARSGRYEMHSHSGDIVLRVATNGFDVEASTFSGDVTSDYAVKLQGTQLEPASGRRRPGRGSSVRGSFGDAGAIVSLRSFSGDIAIARR